MRPSTLMFLILNLFLSANLSAAEGEGEKKEKKQLLYHELPPSLVSNLHTGAKYIRCDIQLMTHDEGYLEEINLHAPALRHELLMLVSDQQGTELKTPKGKEKFRKAALKAVRGVIKELTGKEMIDDLFFTSYFVQ